MVEKHSISPRSVKENHAPQGAKHILVIDDSEMILMVMAEMLKLEGYEVTTAPDGEKGIKSYRNNPADLVITDMVMPGKMGADVIMELREDCPSLSIIAMSGGGDFGPEVELEIARGFNTYTITKPFNPERLLAAIRKIFAKQDAQVKKRVVKEKKPLN